jgi:Epoxide hydrolase N terminus
VGARRRSGTCGGWVLTDWRYPAADAAPGEPWAQGTGRDWLEELLGYWACGFGWRAAARELNRVALPGVARCRAPGG